MTAPPARLTAEARADIQGFVTSGYGHLPASAYLCVRIHDAGSAGRWLRALVPTLATTAAWDVKPPTAVNVAFTAKGLVHCGLPERVMCTFPPEFQQGVATTDRSRILGDTGESAPEHWDVGGPRQPFDAMVLAHAAGERDLAEVVNRQCALLEQAGGGVVELRGCRQYGHRPAHDREHFGFHDGIAQPAIAGLRGRGVPTGEFILGYENHYGVIPPGPLVPAELDAQGLLPALTNPYHGDRSWRDLGRHGTYVVYRKLRQHVGSFWAFMKQEAARVGRDGDVAYMVWLASKCVGRWPSGAPLMLAPERDDRRLAGRDDFLYATDPEGLHCPLGAHVRRSNPRDDIKPYGPTESLHMSEAHRLLRRGRSFGTPLFTPTILDDPTSAEAHQVLLTLQDDGRPRGVHFFCVNASISSQFEFVQQTWCNNPRFGGLRANKDPLVGDQGGHGQPESVMTIPDKTAPRRTSPLPRLVTVSGGAYLFMPGVQALRFLGSQPGGPPSP